MYNYVPPTEKKVLTKIQIKKKFFSEMIFFIQRTYL